MSDIPDEIVERVARAICRQNLISTKQPTDDATMNSYWRSFVYEAKAALTASGWGEMREALNDCVAQIEYMHGKFQTTGTRTTSIARARAALQVKP